MSLITFVLDSTAGIVEIPNKRIPEQTLTLIGYKVTYDTDANALAASLITLNAPFINGTVSDYYKVSGTSDTTIRQGLPILVGPLTGTVVDCNIPFDMVSSIDSNFSYNITADSLTGFESLILIFSYLPTGR